MNSVEIKDIVLLIVGGFIGWLIAWFFDRYKKTLVASYFLEDTNDEFFYFQYRDGWGRSTYSRRPIEGTANETSVSNAEFERVKANLIRRGIP
ncbi:hypothetical protein [Limnohabitans sp.]|jgi:hypothetical protein|uniref:hypothetical protein n=1 Tax=Limnohabitans sp. TaxID=1907725 RepID=UPI0037BE7121